MLRQINHTLILKSKWGNFSESTQIDKPLQRESLVNCKNSSKKPIQTQKISLHLSLEGTGSFCAKKTIKDYSISTHGGIHTSLVQWL